MLLADLGLTQQSLRGHLAERSRFFASRDRLERLQRLISPDDEALDIDRKIIAVLVKADQAEPFSVLIALFDGMLAVSGDALADDGGEADLDRLPPVWAELERFGVQEAFWALMARHFGWREEAPTLKNLLLRLLVSDFAHACRAALPE